MELWTMWMGWIYLSFDWLHRGAFLNDGQSPAGAREKRVGQQRRRLRLLAGDDDAGAGLAALWRVFMGLIFLP